jgi:ActR/RegA family two-component response regulator
MADGDAVMHGDGITILLVDDDDSATSGAAATFRSLGHKIATASDVAGALAAIGADVSIRVMLVEVTLAGATQLVDIVANRYPAVRVIFTTSYPEMLLLDREVPGGRPLLRKPFDADQVSAAFTAVDETEAAQAPAGGQQLAAEVLGHEPPLAVQADTEQQVDANMRSQVRAWRMRAEELRTTADQFEVPSAQDSLRSAARNYEPMADNVENLMERRPPVKDEKAGWASAARPAFRLFGKAADESMSPSGR